jgi:pimeloyl-ACP methyl ester carboxylesterase
MDIVQYSLKAKRQMIILATRKTINGLILAGILAFLASCTTPQTVKPIPHGAEIGVVLLHGKGGDTRWVDPLALALRQAGVQVITPDLPWHRDRIYDKTFDESMIEIDQEVNKFKERGSKHIFVAGHSLGAIAAAGYAARYKGLAGVILLAPGHFTGNIGPAYFTEDLSKAKRMIASGEGEKYSTFGDINVGGRKTRRVKAKIYYSWFAPDGPADFRENMKNINPSTAVLYVGGKYDSIPDTKNRSYAFNNCPPNIKNKFIVINSFHLTVPRNSSEVVLEWLRDFKWKE